jgi:hypothetical protein
MRRILVESARRKMRIKLGGRRERVSLDDCHSPVDKADEVDLTALDEVLSRLAAKAPAKKGPRRIDARRAFCFRTWWN